MGRRLKQPQERRDEVLRVRITRAEGDAIKRLAADFSLTVAQFVRGAVLSGAARPLSQRGLDLDIAALIVTLSPIASNVNQIARILNASHRLPRQPSLDACCSGLIEAIARIRDATS